MAGEKIYRYDGPVLTEIFARDPARLYRMMDVDGAPAYIELTPAEQAAREAEEALPPPEFAGLGAVRAVRIEQVLANATSTAIEFDSEFFDNAKFHDLAVTPDRFTVPVLQAGLYDAKAGVFFHEGDASGTPNAGDRVLQVRVGAQTIMSVRQRASLTGDSALSLSVDLELAVGDVVRVRAFQNCGGTMPVDARFSLRRIEGAV